MGEDPQNTTGEEPVDPNAPGKGTVLLKDEENTNLDHETAHSDEVSVDINVKKVSGSQKKLWILVIIAVVLIAAGGIGFYTQLETGTASITNAGDGQFIPSTKDDIEEVPTSNFAYTVSVSTGDENSHKLLDDSSVQRSFGGSTLQSGSPGIQYSSDGESVAVATSSGIKLTRTDEEDLTAFGDIAQQIDAWVLIPDGSQIYALVNGSLNKYNVKTAEQSVVAEDFEQSGQSVSALTHARDGSIRQYSKNDTALKGSVYDIRLGESELVERSVTRLPRVGNFEPNSVSPDGNSIVFIAELNGSQTLQLLSLNSFVLRTIYVAEVAGNRPIEFDWSQDSNNIIISVSGSEAQLVNLKVGTLEKEVLLSGGADFEQPRWSNTKTHVSFIRGGNLNVMALDEEREVKELHSASAGDISGWFID